MATPHDSSELDTFVGREPELTEARRQLQHKRLVTFVGPPGVGKTRLSQRLIDLERPAFPDGIFQVNLADITDPADLHSSVVRALGLPDNCPRDQTDEMVTTFVREHPHMLLVIDNCEHLIDDVRALVSRLLHAARSLCVLATSRVMLGARGEQRLPIPPLPIDQAVQLLIDRGVAVRPRWAHAVREHGTLPEDCLADARRVCQMLDGIPLAIEMVAKWLDVMSIHEALDHLADRFQLLVAEGSDQPNHVSMRAALDSSYVLLSPAAQRMWTVAATFAGGFDLAAADGVATAAGMQPHEVLAALSSLVWHSMLGAETRDGRTRYTMLDTHRDYAQQLVDDATRQSLRQAHADYFSRLASQAEGDWLSKREVDWMHVLGSNLPNLRLALDYYRHREDHEQFLTMAVAATQTRFGCFSGHIEECRRWLQEGVAHYTTPDELRVAALATAAWLPLIQGADEWQPLLEECRQTARAAGCEDTCAGLLLADATVVFLTEPRQHKARESIGMFGQAADMFKQSSQSGPQFVAAQFAAFAACFLGDRQTATTWTKEAIALAEAAEAPWCIAWEQWTCALLELAHGGDLRVAMTCVQQALEMAWGVGDMWLPGYGLWLAACIAAQTDMPDRAAYLFGGAQQQLRRNGVLVERMLPLWQLQQQAQKTARRQMGDDQFDTQFQRGESSRYEDVMQQALTPVARPLVEEAPIDQESVLGGLTPREQQVAELVARDLRNRAIADELGISVRTVEYFVASLISKLDAGGRVGVAVKYAEWRARRALHNNSHGESPARAPRPSPTSLLADQKRIT